MFRFPVVKRLLQVEHYNIRIQHKPVKAVENQLKAVAALLKLILFHMPQRSINKKRVFYR